MCQHVCVCVEAQHLASKSTLLIDIKFQPQIENLVLESAGPDDGSERGRDITG